MWIHVVAFVPLVLAACTPAQRSSDGATAGAPAASDARPAPSSASVVIATPGGPVRFSVELAVTDAERRQGLMFRERLEEDSGMLFLFEKEQVQSFWMKNTRIPLDMIFIDESGTIAGIVENAEPLTLVSRSVGKPSRYVLEVSGGTSRRLGLAAGEKVRFEGVPAHVVNATLLSGATP
jgi:uncharacterized membrane protein (UPF0127 family)